MRLFCLFVLIGSLVLAGELCQHCWEEEIFTQPTVGIEFGLRYAHVVLRWPNDTIEDVAMIPGNSEYRNAMTSMIYSYHNFNETANTKISVQRPLRVENLSHNQELPFPEVLYPLISMTLSLKSKFDQLLSQPLAILGVSFPVFLSPKYQELILLAIREANLRPTLSYHQTSIPLAVSAAHAIDLCRCPVWTQACIEQAPWQDLLILSIDYSPNALMIFLYESFNPQEGVTYVRTDDPAEHVFFWSEVSDILTAFHNQKRRRQIDHLLLSGSLANDTGLHSAVQKGIGVHGMPLLPPGSRLEAEDAHVPFKLYAPRMADPLMAAAQGTAELGWRSTIKSCIDPCSQWKKLPQCLVDHEANTRR